MSDESLSEELTVVPYAAPVAAPLDDATDITGVNDKERDNQPNNQVNDDSSNIISDRQWFEQEMEEQYVKIIRIGLRPRKRPTTPDKHKNKGTEKGAKQKKYHWTCKRDGTKQRYHGVR